MSIATAIPRLTRATTICRVHRSVMVRISSKLVRQAAGISPLLVPLLRANRTIASAKQELRWIQQELPQNQWHQAVLRRSRLEPLQYILQSQPFGSLDLKCKSGVLIPRWETEEWCSKVADLLVSLKSPLNIVDACTGTGCIPLLLNHELKENHIPNTVTAFDVSNDAVELATENNLRCSLQVQVKRGDLFDGNLMPNLQLTQPIDLITSNPPYIPHRDYISSLQMNGVEKSVRLYEPSLALIGENEFYLALVQNLLAPLGANGFVFELGYTEQADYVHQLLKQDNTWKVAKYHDSAKRIRCVVGWKLGSNMEILQSICDETYDN